MVRLKICDSRLTYKVANKFLNVRDRVEVVERYERWSPPFPCCPVSRQCTWKKTLIGKKISTSRKPPWTRLIYWFLPLLNKHKNNEKWKLSSTNKTRVHFLLVSFDVLRLSVVTEKKSIHLSNTSYPDSFEL